ncbi:hypothetical protein LQG66_20695 [Bradyrhizobium ontarionense]|uniref:DUF4397 domain-containing protein n=1 Tax=Bradyrhizobium ontarionense TaxID=2898149 RepID=A0ABY3R4I4_9BRAD|nr:hypothetical protein [Bradyrhizobium sp. A19]UFZ01736.1 hypothetical protein LQG66_20695 [Bradyrhizobium sp. A19]
MITGYALANAAWTGSPVLLQQYQGVTMPVTPNGSMVLGYFNRATQNNAGVLTITSGGSQPRRLDVPALASYFSVLTQNWQGNNLNISNVSPNSATPIYVEAFGPGIPGVVPRKLLVGTPLQLAVTEAAQGTTLPSYMQLGFTASSATLETLAIVGGPLDTSGNNAYVIALNAPSTSGAGTNVAAPPGYYATTTANSYTFPFNWGAAVVFVANLSSMTSSPVMVQLTSL